MYIRIGQYHLSFSTIDAENSETPVTYEPYVVKSNMSIAANLREALKGAGLKQMGIVRALVILDTPVLLVPVEVFEEQTMADMYYHSFPKKEQEQVLYNVLPDLNTVAVFSINKDLKLVLDDHFRDVRMVTVLQPLWRYLHQRSFTGKNRKLYAYFHEKRLELFSFQQNRFRFSNSFDASRSKDAVFFIAYVWKELQMDAEADELHLMGDISDDETVTTELRAFLKKVLVVNPSADFNQHPVTKVKGIPFDLQALVVKGR